jgi:hypothetical protein
MKRSLKKYDDYLFRLKTLAKALKITIHWRTEPSDGVYQASKRRIIIDPDLTDTETLATLLHELGHVIDDSSLDTRTSTIVGESYSVIYTDIYTAEDVDIVSKTEIRAWNYGAAIAKTLMIPMGKWYDGIAKEAIKAYKKLIKEAK